MKKMKFVDVIKTASSFIREFESESKILKEKIAKIETELESKNREIESRKLAMEATLDEETLEEISKKTAAIQKENLEVVRKALEFDFSKKVASLGELDDSKELSTLDPLTSFLVSLKK